VRLQFITSTPLNITQGSGTYAGIRGLAKALNALGHDVLMVSPKMHLPVYTLERIVFNESLRLRANVDADATVGFDMDGYSVAGKKRVPHIASLKGVIADEVRFERGLTRFTMAIQQRYERLHVKRAAAVVTTSEYAARCAQEAYGIRARVIPELIDLAAWREILRTHPPKPAEKRFVVLCVCRLYRRKRVNVLLGAARLLRDRIPELEIRIVGDGPERARLAHLWREQKLGDRVRFLGDVTRARLAEEYNACHVFCLPSVQEGFGIVYLEAMGAGKPIVAARAAAVPEVVRHGVLVDPESEEALAEGIAGLHESEDLRRQLAREGAAWVEQFDAKRVAERFIDVVREIIEKSSQAERARQLQ